MRLRGLMGILMLTVALTPGCAGRPELLAPPADPSEAAQIDPTLSAVQSRLDAMGHRLERIEQTLADLRDQEQRGQQEQQLQQSLASLRQETRHTQAALARMQKQWAAQHTAVMARLGEKAAKLVDFQAVDIPMGQLPNGGQDYEARPIPAQVPNKAREILIYAQVATGYVKGGAHRFRIAVRLERGREAAFYLHAIGQPQPGWAYNSDNVWLPMPRDRQLLLRTEGEPFFGDWSSDVRIIAYR